MTVVSVSITGPSADWLAEHTRSLVDARLVACGNNYPGRAIDLPLGRRIEDDAEASVILHTRRKHVAAIIERTNAAHPYDTVQILATEIVEADPDYRQWVLRSTTVDGQP